MNTRNKLIKENKKLIKEYQFKFKSIKGFTPFYRKEDGYSSKLSPFKHTSYLIFIRAKFIFLGLLNEINNKNAYAAYALLKPYWETVAIIGYFILNSKDLIEKSDYEELSKLSMKLALGGKKFPTDEMLKNAEKDRETFSQPNLLTMMEKVDKDWRVRMAGIDPTYKDSFKNEYNIFIAEAGHPTFLGLSLSGKTMKDGSILPDVKKSWTKEYEYQIENYTTLASIIFFVYWDLFMDLTTKIKISDKVMKYKLELEKLSNESIIIADRNTHPQKSLKSDAFIENNTVYISPGLSEKETEEKLFHELTHYHFKFLKYPRVEMKSTLTEKESFIIDKLLSLAEDLFVEKYNIEHNYPMNNYDFDSVLKDFSQIHNSGKFINVGNMVLPPELHLFITKLSFIRLLIDKKCSKTQRSFILEICTANLGEDHTKNTNIIANSLKDILFQGDTDQIKLDRMFRYLLKVFSLKDKIKVVI